MQYHAIGNHSQNVSLTQFVLLTATTEGGTPLFDIIYHKSYNTVNCFIIFTPENYNVPHPQREIAYSILSTLYQSVLKTGTQHPVHPCVTLASLQLSYYLLLLMTLLTCYVGVPARRRAASRKMKQMKQHGSKDTDELEQEEDNEDMFAEIGGKDNLLPFHNLVDLDGRDNSYGESPHLNLASNV